MERSLTIGDVVRRTGLTERTLRYYEEQGLINPPRSSGGRRLVRAKGALAANESLDIESLCNLIHLGEQQMKSDALKDYIDKHFTLEEQERWKDAKLKAAGDDPDGYLRRLNHLIRRIQQALPLDPASHAAQTFLAEWNSAQQPFVDALDDDMKAQVQSAPSVPGMEPIQDFLKAAKAASVSK